MAALTADTCLYLWLSLKEVLTNPVRKPLRIGYIKKTTKRLDGLVAIVTGANTGLGYETALELAKRGAKVIMACRNLAKSSVARDRIVSITGNPSVLVMHLDLACFDSVRNFAAKILDSETNVDILVNNAGLSVDKYAQTEDHFETHFEVNYLSHFLLTILLMDKLRKSKVAKIVNVSSDFHLAVNDVSFEEANRKAKYTRTKAYCVSKLAQAVFTKELAKRVPSVKVYAIHPGLVKTDLFRDNKSLFWWFALKFSRTPEQGVQPILHCLLSDKADQQSGLYYRECHAGRPSSIVRNPEVGTKLWKLSCKMLNLDSSKYI